MKALCLIIACVAAAATFVQAQNGTNTPVTDEENSSTTKPTTTAGTTSAQTSAPTTTPLPAEPPSGKWSVNTTTNSVCILANLGARFTFNYNVSGGKNQTVTQDLNVNHTTASGQCSPNVSHITLTSDSACNLTMEFKLKDKKFSVDKISISFDPKCFTVAPTDTVTGQMVNLTLFQATVGQSYMCNSEQTFNLDNNINKMTLEVVDLQLQAFLNQTSTAFGTAQECPQDAETSNIVPIAVGAALAALVLIVLIAYLISRNRGQRGYESV